MKTISSVKIIWNLESIQTTPVYSNLALSIPTVQNKRKISFVNFSTTYEADIYYFSQSVLNAEFYLTELDYSCTVCKTSLDYFWQSAVTAEFYVVQQDFFCTVCRTGIDYFHNLHLLSSFMLLSYTCFRLYGEYVNSFSKYTFNAEFYLVKIRPFTSVCRKVQIILPNPH